MISGPTNFQHTGHIGSGDLSMSNTHLNNIESQMQGKGGYETSFGVKVLENKHSTTNFKNHSYVVPYIRPDIDSDVSHI